MTSCPACGQGNPDGSGFCQKCGATLQSGATGAAAPLKTSGKAIASLILGIPFFILPAAILAVIFGHLSLSEIRSSAGRLKGVGMAIAGLVLGYAGISIIPILIIAAIAIPNLLRSKMAANEASAVGSLRSIKTACVTYATTYGVGFPAALSTLGPTETPSSTTADLIDGLLASGTKSGYKFTYAVGAAVGGQIPIYTINADPVSPGTTGQRHFFTDQTAVIRVEINGPAGERSPPIN